MEASAPISLYLDLDNDEVADFDVALRLGLAFSASVKEMIHAVDPWAGVRLELIGTTKGSLSFNGMIRSVKAFATAHPVATAWALSMMTIMGGDLRQWTTSKIFDLLSGNDAPPSVHAMTDNERQALADDIAKRINNQTAADSRRQIFREAERDPHIKGIGATGIAGKRPETVVPRSEFAERTAQVTEQEEVSRRKVTSVMTVTLVRPVLKNEERSWKFQQGTFPDFGATMKDHEFLAAMADGRLELPLKVGIDMELELEVREERQGSVWVPIERSVTRVLRPRASPPLDQLPLKSSK